eukprot:bmy_08249T0
MAHFLAPSKAVLLPGEEGGEFYGEVRGGIHAGVRGRFVLNYKAFNHWLKVPEDKLQIITEVTEMLHNASLLIDDIEDNSKLRRGFPVAHSIYGIPSVINSANYVYFLGLAKVLTLDHPDAVKLFTRQLLELHQGQGLDIYWRDNYTSPTEEECKATSIQTLRKHLSFMPGIMYKREYKAQGLSYSINHPRVGLFPPFFYEQLALMDDTRGEKTTLDMIDHCTYRCRDRFADEGQTPGTLIKRGLVGMYQGPDFSKRYLKWSEKQIQLPRFDIQRETTDKESPDLEDKYKKNLQSNIVFMGNSKCLLVNALGDDTANKMSSAETDQPLVKLQFLRGTGFKMEQVVRFLLPDNGHLLDLKTCSFSSPEKGQDYGPNTAQGSNAFIAFDISSGQTPSEELDPTVNFSSQCILNNHPQCTVVLTTTEVIKENVISSHKFKEFSRIVSTKQAQAGSKTVLLQLRKNSQNCQNLGACEGSFLVDMTCPLFFTWVEGSLLDLEGQINQAQNYSNPKLEVNTICAFPRGKNQLSSAKFRKDST